MDFIVFRMVIGFIVNRVVIRLIVNSNSTCSSISEINHKKIASIQTQPKCNQPWGFCVAHPQGYPGGL